MLFFSCDRDISIQQHVSGTVFYNGAGLANVEISAGPVGGNVLQKSVTNSEGKYVINNLAPGSYTITTSCDGYIFSPASQNITLRGGRNTTNINFSAALSDDERYSISGKIVMDDDTGIMDLLKNTGKQFDEQLIRVLVFTLSIYPVGTYVLLSNGTQGIVAETDSERPKFPIVKLLLNEEGGIFRDQPLLHTSEGSGTSIVRPLIQKEIEKR